MSKPKFTVYADPVYPNGKMLMGHQGKSFLSSGPLAPYNELPEPMEPSAIERLGGLVDPELQEDIDNRDKARRLLDHFEIKTFDFVSDPSCPKVVPLE